MKISTRQCLWLAAAVLLFVDGWVAKADESHCANDSVYCAYISGIPEHEGRYLRFIANGTPLGVQCMNNISTIEIHGPEIDELGESGIFHLGKNVLQFAACTDKEGSQCEIFGKEDGVMITKAKGGRRYQFQPPHYHVDFSSVSAKFKACDMSSE